MRFDVGVIATHVSPASGYGGVSVSAARLTAAWARNNRARHIGLCASDASENYVIDAKDVRLGTNVDVYLYRSYWFRRWGFGLGAIGHILSLCRRSNAIYIHGIATWPTTLGALICCLIGRPFAVAPRGGLMPEHVEHIRRHKPAKWLYYRLLTFPTLRRAHAIHCTGAIEVDSVRAVLSWDIPVLIIPNGIDLEPIRNAIPPPIQNGLILSYVGRISSEKGINSFLQAWFEVKGPSDKFIVAGGNSGVSRDKYFENFLELVSQSGGAIDYQGYVDNSEVKKILNASHFLVLPSGLDGDVRDNFGNAVAEALAMCRPAIVCRGLVWDDLESAGAGFIFDRDLYGAKTVIQRSAAMSMVGWLDMTRKARSYAEQWLDINAVAERSWSALTYKRTR